MDDEERELLTDLLSQVRMQNELLLCIFDGMPGTGNAKVPGWIRSKIYERR